MKSDALLAVTGDYEAEIETRRLAVLRALRTGVEFATDSVKQEWRADIRRAGLGNRLANTVRGEVFPDRKLSWRPAGFVFSKAEHIIASFDKGETIRAGNGHLRAVPIPGSGADKLKPIDDGTGRRSHVAAARKRFGDRLFVIPRRGASPPMIALKGGAVSQKTGRVSARRRLKSGNFGKGTGTVFLFWLIDQSRMDKRLNIARIANRGQRRLAARVAFALSRELSAVQS